jgi:tRNA pseudouridine55 synthase
LAKFTGALAQTPPMYSALKRDGKPLYEYARAGVTLERVPRDITIHSMALIDFDLDRFTIDVSCSKGTYIRVLAEDIGAALGCGATLAGLTRTRVGSFDLAQAVTLTVLEQMPETQRAASLLPVDCLASGLPAITLDAVAVARILQGQVAQVEFAALGAGTVRIYGPEARFLGLAELDLGGRLMPKRLIATSKVAARDEQLLTPKIA